eukprot:2911_1
MSFKQRRGSVTSYKPSPIQLPIHTINRINRRNDQFRTIKFEYNLIPEASGSVYAEYGKTKIITAIYGPKQSRNVSTFSNEGRFKCNFHYAPFAFSERLTESRGKSIKERDIASNIEKALKNVIVLDKYPKCTIEAHVWLLECDGNTLSCAINTTSLALVYAGIEMIDFITCSQAIIMNKMDKNKNNNQNQITLLDATLSEERYINKECEIIVSFMNQKKQITLLNMNGSLSSQKTKETLQLCLNACLQLKHLMKTSLFKHYTSKMTTK